MREMKSGRMSRAGHIARIGEMGMAYVLVRKPKKRNYIWDLA
jgi:hypothetical protein